jgi:hypothetical protein
VTHLIAIRPAKCRTAAADSDVPGKRPEERNGEMVAIKIYDIETGHVETLTEVPTPESARAWLETFGTGGVGANDVIYMTDVDER